MHRSYEITSPIKFYQYSDRVEIVNPGGLYGNARPENFPNVSDYRNLVIAESMRVMGFVNRFNRGIETAQLDLKNNGNEPAKFDLRTLGVFGVIIKEKPIEKISADFSNPWDGNTVNFDDLSEIEKKIYTIIKENQGIKATDIIDLMDKSPRTIERYLKNLKETGFVEYVGSLNPHCSFALKKL
ncbi:hypothetical protein AGMMS50262_20800 [Bacteroidia bacterium]|nr:hypothetical protein AGMMS50262_20800 [Bacteroidia bacterium]